MMFRNTALLLLAGLLATSCKQAHGDLPEVNLRAGLVAHYPFDGNAENVLLENGNLTVSKAVLTTDRFGREGCAFSFDGLASMLWTEVHGLPSPASSQAFSWWYYQEKPQSYKHKNDAGNMIVLVSSEGGIGVQFGFRSPNYKTLGLDTWQWGGSTVLEAKPPAIKVWHHCVYCFDGTTHLFFIDGKKVASSKTLPQDGVPSQLMIGNFPTGSQFFAGKIDDVRIYNRALSILEIKSLNEQLALP